MPIRPSHALLAVLAMIAAPAFAQDSTPDAPATGNDAATEQPAETAEQDNAEAAPEAAEAPEALAQEDQAEATEATPSEPQVGQYYAKTTHSDWTIRCVKTDQGVDPCELYQLLRDDEGNSVAEMTLIPLRNSEVAAGATLVAPLETDLLHGIGFGIDNAEARGYPFALCAPIGCVSRMGFTAAELNSLKRGNSVKVTLLPFGGDPNQPVQLDLSLTGFTAAFDELAVYAAEAQAASGNPAAE